MSEPSPEEISELFQEYSDRFFELRVKRHEKDTSAPFAFLSADVVTAMMESLADLANRCEMEFIKLALLQRYLSEDLEDKGIGNEDVRIGLKAFRGSKDEWKRQ